MTTSIKTCFKCNKPKELSEFYRHATMGDGHLNKCKECAKRDVREHRRDNESVREYDRSRGSRCSAEALREYRAKYPVKYKAHCALSNAVRDGRITKPMACEDCNSTFAIHGHHDDYSKPLEIRWLCAKCHHRWHAENGEGRNAA